MIHSFVLPYLTTFLFSLFFVLSSAAAAAQESPVAFPERSEPSLQEGFAEPPAGYGEVPFWWWTGEKLDVERLCWQLDELNKKGISGVQVNYAHQDVRNETQPNWLTYPNEPEVFTEEWFNVFDQVREHCRKLGMAIGVSGYTLDWQNSPGNLFDRLIYSDSELQSRTLYVARKVELKGGEKWSTLLERAPEVLENTPNDVLVGIAAYPSGASGNVEYLGADSDALAANDNLIANDCQVWIYRAKRIPHTLNPLHPESGKQVVERFFQPFEDRALKASDDAVATSSTLGLEYFFQDELQIGTGETIWHDDLAAEFEARKGYPLWSALPAMFGADCGDLTEKYRLDFMDVRVRLAEERYFIPIFNWHASRGRIYACDPGSRGKDPSEFCDYFSAVRWYTAPGHDTPGGHADFIKNKVSSSIAHFYQRPRVWLEGYHSFGWGATPERLLFATNENFLFGANLLNLHGLYYTTYGGYWEWAPPCYHFRQPYWETFGRFLKYFERLSFALTRGVEQPEFVVLYPVSSYQANLGGERARDVAFEAARRIFASGHDVLFIDDDSIARSEIVDGRLHVAGASHRVLVLPSTRGIRFQTLCQARELCESGGVVVALDALPEATDRAGRRDETLRRVVNEYFSQGRFGDSVVQTDSGGIAAFFSPRAESSEEASGGDPVVAVTADQNGDALMWSRFDAFLEEFPRDVFDANSGDPCSFMKRTTSDADLYFVMKGKKNAALTFRSSGRVELYDAWTGTSRELPAARRSTPEGQTTTIRWPYEETEAGLVVFWRNEEPTEPDEIPELQNSERRATLTLDGEWGFRLLPNLDNRWGDFRLPIHDETIGAEAQRFDITVEGDKVAENALNDFGPKYLVLGPFPSDSRFSELDAKLSALKSVAPNDMFTFNDRTYVWDVRSFSWRWGVEGNPGHEGYHGLKEKIDSRFIALGRPTDGFNETIYAPEESGSVYYLWTTVPVNFADQTSVDSQVVDVYASGDAPTAIWLDGKRLDLSADETLVSTPERYRPVLARYETAGRRALAFVERGEQGGEGASKLIMANGLDSGAFNGMSTGLREETPDFIAAPERRTPLSTVWFDTPGVLDYDVYGGEGASVESLSFVAPPGLKKLTIPTYGSFVSFENPSQTKRTVEVESEIGWEYWRGLTHDERFGTIEEPRSLAFSDRSLRIIEITLEEPLERDEEVTITLSTRPGVHGAALCPEPIRLQCESGVTTLGDWNERGVLANYSGGARYSKEFEWKAKLGANERAILDLGAVGSSCRVWFNGEHIGDLPTPPYTIDVTEFLRNGENSVEIDVYNTAANIFRNIPTRYGGNPVSGLIGPVEIRIENE
ncbi:MAG: glycosyl hydrolase [Thermoguttaceae bacterium]|jgi:hypothetical protein